MTKTNAAFKIYLHILLAMTEEEKTPSFSSLFHVLRSEFFGGATLTYVRAPNV